MLLGPAGILQTVGEKLPREAAHSVNRLDNRGEHRERVFPFLTAVTPSGQHVFRDVAALFPKRPAGTNLLKQNRAFGEPHAEMCAQSGSMLVRRLFWKRRLLRRCPRVQIFS